MKLNLNVISHILHGLPIDAIALKSNLNIENIASSHMNHDGSLVKRVTSAWTS